MRCIHTCTAHVPLCKRVSISAVTVSYTHLDVYKRQVYHEYVPPSHTITKVYYEKFLAGWRMLCGGNGSSCEQGVTITFTMITFTMTMDLHVLAHHITPPYTTPPDFWLLSMLKLPLKGKKFQMVEMRENSTGQMIANPKEEFGHYFEKWRITGGTVSGSVWSYKWSISKKPFVY